MALTEQEELELLRLRKQRSTVQEAPVPLKIGVEGMGDAMSAVMKDKSWAERNVASFGSFPRQMYEGAKQILGKGDEGNVRALREMDKEAPVGAVGGALASMIPLSRIPGLSSIGGQTAQGSGMGALMPTLGDESRGQNAATSGLVAGGLSGLMKAASPYASKLFSSSESAAATKASQSSVRDATIEAAQKEGYVIPPTVTGGGATAKALESLGGKAAVGQEASIRNQQVTNRIARVEAGLKPDEAISEASLAKARQAMSEPYREVAAISPRASQALEKLQEARLDAKDAWKKYSGPSGGPEERKLALAADSKVSVLEKLIDKEATAAGDPGLVNRLREARINLAKNHDVESALNVGTGDIDAIRIGRILDKRGEKAVTGGLQTVGKFANAFQTFAREAPAGQSAPGVSKLTPYAATLLGVGGYGASEHYGMGPWGAAAAALPMLSGPARSIALSKMMQSGPTYGPSKMLNLADLAAKSKALPGATAGAGLTLQDISQ